MSDQTEPSSFSRQESATEGPIHPLERPAVNPPPVQPLPAAYPVVRVEAPYNRPVLSYVLLTLNIVVFLVDTLMAWIGLGYSHIGLLTLLGAKNNAAIVDGQYWRLVTPMFLHAGILHLAFNGYFLYRLGPWVEHHFGTARFAAIYFLSGVGASLASVMLNPNLAVGASGALFGLIGSMLPMLYRNRALIANTRSLMNSILLTIAINLLIGFSSSGIDNWAHVGGLVCGVVLGWLISPRLAIRERTPDLVRIEDRSSPLRVWLAVAAFMLGLVILAVALVRFAPL